MTTNEVDAPLEPILAEYERLRRRLGFTAEPEPLIDGRYRAVRTLGQGAMGEVRLARDQRLGRTVALKVVRMNGAVDPAMLRARLAREALTLARVDHPNVVRVFDVGNHAGQTYFTMQYVAGTTLRTWQAGRTAAEIVAAYLQAARGLAAAHAVDVIHRDFKPETRPSSQKAPHPAKPRGSPPWRAFSEGRSAARCPARPLRAPNPAPKTSPLQAWSERKRSPSQRRAQNAPGERWIVGGGVLTCRRLTMRQHTTER